MKYTSKKASLRIQLLGQHLTHLCIQPASLVPSLSLHLSVLQAMESWVGPRNEASIQLQNVKLSYTVCICRFTCSVLLLQVLHGGCS